MAQACEAACNNNHIGYDQSQRNTLNQQAQLVGYNLAKIKTDCECDCSSLMTVCAQAAGISVPYTNGNAPRTANMEQAFASTGMFEVLKDTIYLESDRYLKRGDILVTPGSHTAMALQDGVADKYPTLKRGSSGEYVRRMQARLVVKGYKIAVDGHFGEQSGAALVKFQTAAFPLQPKEWDGICGPKTWAALNN